MLRRSKDHPYVQNMYNFSVKQWQLPPSAPFLLFFPHPRKGTDTVCEILVTSNSRSLSLNSNWNSTEVVALKPTLR